MAYRLFLNINILVDFFDRSRQHHEPTKQLMQKIEDEIITGFGICNQHDGLSYSKRVYTKGFT